MHNMVERLRAVPDHLATLTGVKVQRWDCERLPDAELGRGLIST